MTVYLQIIKFNFLKYLAYPAETLGIFVEKIVSLGFLILFWFVVSKGGGDVINFREIVAYFLISGAINDFTFARDYKFGRNIQKAIKRGEINNYMIKPLSLIPYLFSGLYIGNYGFNLIMGLLYFIGGLLILPTLTFVNLLVFIPFYICALSISLSLNIFVATFQFYTTEAGGLKNVFLHITRILSGSIIPIFLFPSTMRSIVEKLPFSAMIYGPTNALRTTNFDSKLALLLIVSIFWAIVLPQISLRIWNKALKNYDAVGI